MDSAALIRRFASARLGARVFTDSARGIFELGISDGRAPRFDLWPGAADNRVEVEGTDRSLRQLILFVHEQPRAFREQLSRRNIERGLIRIDWNVVRRVGEDAHWVTVERVTPGRKRHFLCGIDERDAFIAQLPRPATTVREAHAALRAPSLRRDDDVVRQGEWFFLRPPPSELAWLEAALARGDAYASGRRAIGPGGKPHLADEIAVTVPHRDRRDAPRQMYARGRVRHPDHATLYLDSWHRVVRNAEVVEAGIARMDGVRWVD